MRRQDRPGRDQQVRPHLTLRRSQAERPEGRPEHFGGEVLSIGAVPHLCAHQPVEPLDIVPVHRFPVRIYVGVYQSQVGATLRPAGWLVTFGFG